MKKIFLLLILTTFISIAYGQKELNTRLVSNVTLDDGEEGNDIWGYVDSLGVEYAILGTTRGTRIYSLEDKANPIERIFIPGATSIWRDMKSYKSFVYVTTDQGADGLLIIDMTNAPENITYRFWQPELTIGNIPEVLQKCHNIYIDTTDGHAYLAGCNNGRGGVLILELDEMGSDPIHVGTEDVAYAHDVFVLNGLMYTSDLTRGFGVYDISDKSNPTLLASELTTTQFTHNAWTSPDGKYLFTTDEKRNAALDAFDLTDLNDIVYLGSWKPIETINTGVIPHNTHYHNGYLYTSWYTDGLIVKDVKDPSNIVEVAAYDTYIGDDIGNGFKGLWGTYPYLPSGYILGSDIEEGLFIWQTTDNYGNVGIASAARLEGRVIDIMDQTPIANAFIRIISDINNLSESDAIGEYKTGIAKGGTFLVEVSHEDYGVDTFSVVLEEGETREVDFKLGSIPTTGVVYNEFGEPLMGAKVVRYNALTGREDVFVADDEGRYNFDINPADSLHLFVGQWGYLPKKMIVSGVEDLPEIVLEAGYADDFFVDLGWTVIEESEAGNWEIGEPMGIYFGDVLVETDGDDMDDIGYKCYVTERNSGSLGENDVDGGTTVLMSPDMDFTGYMGAKINLSYFLVALDSDMPSTDRFIISISNGDDDLDIYDSKTPTTDWESLTLVVNDDMIAFSETMNVMIKAQDVDGSNFVEAQVDVFSVELSESTISSVEEVDNDISIFPNPTSNRVKITGVAPEKIWISNTSGEVLISWNAAYEIEVSELLNGLYILNIQDANGQLHTRKLIKM